MQHTAGRPSRRSVLAAAAFACLPLAACSGSTRPAAPVPRRSASADPDPDPAIRHHAVEATTALIAAYDSVLATHPQLAGRLGPLRAQLVQHREAFAATGASSPTASSAVRPRTAPTGTPPPVTVPPSSTPVPAKPAAALGALAAAEHSTADGRIAALATASPELARLLASVAAAGAVHALLLGMPS